MAITNVGKANRKVAKALSGFGAAHKKVLKAQAILENDLESVQAEIGELEVAKSEVETQLDKTASVAAKLAEFVI